MKEIDTVVAYIRENPGANNRHLEAALRSAIYLTLNQIEYRDGGWYPKEPIQAGDGLARIPELIERIGPDATRTILVDALRTKDEVPAPTMITPEKAAELLAARGLRPIDKDELQRQLALMSTKSPLTVLSEFLAGHFAHQSWFDGEAVEGTEVQVYGWGWEAKLRAVLLELERLSGLETAVRALHPTNSCMRKRVPGKHPGMWHYVPCGECPECQVHAALAAAPEVPS